MADTKTSALTVFSIDAEDLLYAVDDPSSTPTSGKTLASSLMFNRYKLVVTVATNDLTVKVTHPDGNNPSSARPLYFKIGDTIRSATAALSITIADGTNWFNAGSAELGTLAVPYFVYVVWDSNSSAVALTIARKPHYRIVAAAMATTTSENHIYNYANFTDGDDMANIGYFEAILSLSGTSHLWTVPTFTNDNLRHEPTFESQQMTYTPTLTGFSGTPTVGAAVYQVKHNLIHIALDNISGTSNATTFTVTSPFSNTATTNYLSVGGSLTDNGSVLTVAGRVGMSTSTNIIGIFTDMASGVWTGSGTKGAYFSMTHYI